MSKWQVIVKKAVKPLRCKPPMRPAFIHHLLPVCVGLRRACFLDFCLRPRAELVRCMGQLNADHPDTPFKLLYLGGIATPFVVNVSLLLQGFRQGFNGLVFVDISPHLATPTLADTQKPIRVLSSFASRVEAALSRAQQVPADAVIELDDSLSRHLCTISGWLPWDIQ
eukprot:NODE_3816_length_892_cov_26.724183_g3663_i0.p1 GENE.NODE_3816_length_892_cov_26.724183_g3663_i0~~NODE_3816_length_892_cov_26.724183_g3663_i0.p1  ORF type:complete len:182 (+),score=62.16 NODE_3816_length_892_cov_26.724183_g3663_i0:44-547(+)